MQKSAISLIAVIAAMGAMPANAQDAPSEQAGQPYGVDDIIVTAQRREERNQDVPIAITAFSAERLSEQNLTTAQNLAGTVPSLVVGANGQASREVQSFTLRGIGPSYQGGASVVQYLAEVPLPEGFSASQQGGPGNYIDLESLQVLAGPQGTLFGRNSTGGAVLLVPKKPTNKFEAYVEGSVGNYDYRGIEAMVNAPLIDDKLLVRIVGTFQDRRGYTRDIVWNKDRDDMHYFAGRIGVTFKPTETIENYLLAYGSVSDNNGTTYVNDAITVPGAFAQRQGELARQLGKRVVRNSVDAFDKTETWGVVNKTSIGLSDALTINNILSYQRYKKNYALDEDGTPLQIADLGPRRLPDFPVAGVCDEFGVACNGYGNEYQYGPRDDLDQFTEELQLQGNFLDGHLTTTVGGFYYNQTPAGPQSNRALFACTPEQVGTCAPITQYHRVSTKSKALYAQATLDLGAFTPALESLRLTAGYRYTWDTIVGVSNTYIPFAPSVNYCNTSGQIIADIADCETGSTRNDKAPTWTFGVDYKPIRDVLVFAKVSRGYKAGGYNPFAVTAASLTFGTEKVTSVEAGFKSDWRLGTVPLRLNVTAYSTDFDPVLKSAPEINSIGLAGSTKLPATAQIRGIEADGTIRPFRFLELGGNVAYTDAKHKQFTYITPTATTGCNGAVAAGGFLDRTCDPFGTAEWTYNIRGTLDLPIPEQWGNLSLFANYAYISQQGGGFNEPGATIAPYGLLNLSVNWKSIAQSNMDIQLFMTNATDKLYRVSNAGLSSLGFQASIYSEPRMYGMRLRYRFGQD